MRLLDTYLQVFVESRAVRTTRAAVVGSVGEGFRSEHKEDLNKAEEDTGMDGHKTRSLNSQDWKDSHHGTILHFAFRGSRPESSSGTTPDFKMGSGFPVDS